MENRFFTWVWRLNGLLLLLCLIALCLFLLAETLRGPISWMMARGVPEQVLTEETEPVADNWETVLRKPLNTDISGLYVFPLAVEGSSLKGSFVYKSGGPGYLANSVLNYQIADLATGTTRWLFDDNAQVITETRRLSHDQDETSGYILSVIESDSNEDGRLSRNDLVTLYYVPTDWAGKTIIGSATAGLFDLMPADGTHFDMVVETADARILKRLRLPSLEVVSEIPLE
jgi:hypothetical protein